MGKKEMFGKAVFMLLVFMGVSDRALFPAAAQGLAAEAGEDLLMATTTSTDDTGLLDYLMPSFTARTGITIRWIATGTGKALKLGENCDVDVLLVHAPKAETEFINKGFGTTRKELMYNDFVLIGPVEDPAGIRGKRLPAALQAIKSSGAIFISRGDNSGTHKKEQELWKTTNMGTPEQESWYKQSGQGMLATITMAAELQGYTLTDRGTYITYESGADGKPILVMVVEGGADLLNQYSAIPVDPAHCPSVKIAKAQAFSDWMAGDEGQRLIGGFRLLDKQLFTPNAGR